MFFDKEIKLKILRLRINTKEALVLKKHLTDAEDTQQRHRYRIKTKPS